MIIILFIISKLLLAEPLIGDISTSSNINKYNYKITYQQCPIYNMTNDIIIHANILIPFINPNGSSIFEYIENLTIFSNRLKQECQISSANLIKVNYMFIILIATVCDFHPIFIGISGLALYVNADSLNIDNRTIPINNAECPIGTLCDYYLTISNDLDKYIKILNVSNDDIEILNTIKLINESLMQFDKLYTSDSNKTRITILYVILILLNINFL